MSEEKRGTGKSFLPYGRQQINQEDIQAVVDVLKSDWLTQGPMVPLFENKLTQLLGADSAVACTSGTAALHLVMLALGIGPGDEIVTTANTFLADANCARYVGADVRFADIDSDTGNISTQSVAELLERDSKHRIKVILPVHFAGQPCDLESLKELASGHGASLVDDACHALGAATDMGGQLRPVGNGDDSAMTVFSFHPVKHVATGEGGAVSTSDPELADRLRLFRNHGMTKENLVNSDMALNGSGEPNPWYYEMQALGYNYRLTDIQAALGVSQLDRLRESVDRRNEIADHYRRLIGERFPGGEVVPLVSVPNTRHAHHLFVLQIQFDELGVYRSKVMTDLREAGIGTQVHYIPVPLQPYYRNYGGWAEADFPEAMKYYRRALSIPMYPGVTGDDCDRVIEALAAALGV